MKLLLTASVVCLCLVFAFPVSDVHAAENPGGIGVFNFPEVNGKLVKAVRYTDSTGDNLLLLTETDIVVNPENKDTQETWSKELFAHRFLLKKSGAAEQIWRVADYVRDCHLDALYAEFIMDAFRITDLNNNGQAEVWLPYILQCAGDPSPMTMKIIMYEGDKKYAVRGKTRSRVDENTYAGGDYAMDPALLGGPAEFSTFATQLWERYKTVN